MANNVYKNLNCKIDKSVSDKLKKFIADTHTFQDCYGEENVERIIGRYNKQARFKKIVLVITKGAVKDSYISETHPILKRTVADASVLFVRKIPKSKGIYHTMI